MIKIVILLAAICTVLYAADEKCGPNEEYRECGTACEPKCNEPMPDLCTMQCVVNVCQCKAGFKRGPKGCVLPSKSCR